METKNKIVKMSFLDIRTMNEGQSLHTLFQYNITKYFIFWNVKRTPHKG